MSGDGLEWNGFTIDDWLEEFDQSTTMTRRESKKILYQGAKDIMQASQQMAPVDEGNLEAAHSLAQVRLNEDYSEVEIDVGGVVGGREVDDYAMIVHEGVAPYGSGTAGSIGERSQVKDAGNPSDRRVGGKFLERAVDLLQEDIVQKVAATLPGEP